MSRAWVALLAVALVACDERELAAPSATPEPPRTSTLSLGGLSVEVPKELVPLERAFIDGVVADTRRPGDAHSEIEMLGVGPGSGGREICRR